MRKLTDYEKDTWTLYDLGEDHFLGRGDELGEAFDALLSVLASADYLDKETVRAAYVNALDMYYYQIHYYTGEYGGYDEAEDLGLPPLDVFRDMVVEAGGDPNAVDETKDEYKKAFDVAMEWREEHWQETREQWRIKNLRAELERLEKK